MENVLTSAACAVAAASIRKKTRSIELLYNAAGGRALAFTGTRVNLNFGQMNILFIGDIFGSPGRRIVADHLQDIVATNEIDLAIANAENSAGGFGVTPAIAEDLFA